MNNRDNTKNRKDKWMRDINSAILIFKSKSNGLNTPTKGQIIKVNYYFKEARPT